MADGPWLSNREQRAWRGFLAVQQQLNRRIAQDLQRKTGLSLADYEVLVRLSEAPGQTLRAIELAAATDWEKSRLSHQIGRMTERGLIAKELCGNTRHAHVTLTPRGRSVIEAAAPLHVAHVRRVFVDALSPEQIDALADASTAILTHLCGGATPCDPDEAGSFAPPCDGTAAEVASA